MSTSIEAKLLVIIDQLKAIEQRIHVIESHVVAVRADLKIKPNSSLKQVSYDALVYDDDPGDEILLLGKVR